MALRKVSTRPACSCACAGAHRVFQPCCHGRQVSCAHGGGQAFEGMKCAHGLGLFLRAQGLKHLLRYLLHLFGKGAQHVGVHGLVAAHAVQGARHIQIARRVVMHLR